MSQSQDIPLAIKYRPQIKDALIGQEHIWSSGSALQTMVQKDRFPPLLFWGPPGTGKTSLARLIGRMSERPQVELSSVEAGVKEIRAVIENSKKQLSSGLPASLLFLDEIHRLNKAQQDVLLPALEEGSLRFIGATTENPSMSVNNAILSRSLCFSFVKITAAALASHLHLIAQQEGFSLEDELALCLAEAADGDARAALNLLESLLLVHSDQKKLSLEICRQALPHLARRFDKKGDFHYELISALIKSIRASDPDAAVYYLARMLSAGEDPVFIARRLVIAASEDIGNALPTALVLAEAALRATRDIGMPEARIILAQATTYLASSPKSNRSYLAINKAMDCVDKTGDLPVPLHLRNAPTQFMKNLAYGRDYVYPHDQASKAWSQNNLPETLQGQRYYEPSDQGSEKAIQTYLSSLRPKS